MSIRILRILKNKENCEEKDENKWKREDGILIMIQY